MKLRDCLFPGGEESRNDALLQTQWSDGWADEFSGLGALLHWMTPKLQELHAAMDYAGSAVVFLQRHRVELGLKALAHYAGAKFREGHKLEVLWCEAENALKPKYPDSWEAFSRAHCEFVHLLAEVDSENDTFRYPVKKSGARVERPIFIDLVALEYVGAAFERDVEYWLHDLEVCDVGEDFDDLSLDQSNTPSHEGSASAI